MTFGTDTIAPAIAAAMCTTQMRSRSLDQRDKVLLSDEIMHRL